MTRIKSNITLTSPINRYGDADGAGEAGQGGATQIAEGAPQQGPPDVLEGLGKKIKAAQARQAQQAQGENTATQTGQTMATPGAGKATTQAAAQKGENASGYQKKKFSLKEATAAQGAEATQAATEGQAATQGSGLTEQEREELSNLRSLMSDPSIKTVLKAKDKGRPFLEFYDELRSRDPKKMSYKDLYKSQLTEMGLTAEEITRREEKFDLLDDDDQLEKVALYRKDLETRYGKELEEYTPKFNKQADPWDGLRDPYQAQAKNFVEGKKSILGIAVTPELAQQTVDFYNSGSLVELTKDGGLDPEDLFRKTFLINNIDLIINQQREEAYVDGVKFGEEKNGVGKPLPSQHGAGAQPSGQNVKGEKKKQIDNLIASLPGAGV